MGNEGKFGRVGGQEIHGGAAIDDERLGKVEGLDGEIHGGAQPINPVMNTVTEELAAEAAREQGRAAAAMDQRYSDLGGVRSPLGLKLDDTVTLEADGTYRRSTSGGYLVYTRSNNDAGGDTKAVVTNVAKIVYKGLKCFGTQGDTRDESYVVISIVQPNQYVDGNRITVAAVRAPAEGTYTNVAPGSVNTAGLQEFFSDAPQDIIIHSAVMEHDEGDPEKVKKAVSEAVQKGADAGAAALSGGAVTHAPLDADSLQGMAKEGLASLVAKLTGAGDDLLGEGAFMIKHEDWASGNFAPMKHRDGIDYNYVQYCTDGDASYDVMYEVSVFHTSREL